MKQKNILNKDTFPVTGNTNRCFICYQFELDKDVSFSSSEFDASLDKTYRIKDTSDQCAGPLGDPARNQQCGNFGR